MGNPSSVLAGKATSIKWAAQISLLGGERPVSQPVARASHRWLLTSLNEQKSGENMFVRMLCELTWPEF